MYTDAVGNYEVSDVCDEDSGIVRYSLYLERGPEISIDGDLICDSVKVMGSDTIRWETLKTAYIDKFLDTYSIGYKYEDDSSSAQVLESSQCDDIEIIDEK